MSDARDLQPGEKFRHRDYFWLDVIELGDGVYPHIRTGPATMTLPFRQTPYGLEVCLLEQSRADTHGESILKVSGGYNGNLNRKEAALQHTKKKLGLVPGEYDLVWWRQCLGVGQQYQFPIDYSFLPSPTEISVGLSSGCTRRWLKLEEACRMATARRTKFFDDFSSAHLLALLMHWEEIMA